MMKIMGGGGSNTPTPPTSGGLASLQKASKTWKSFDWSSRASQWEATTSENKELRDSSMAARKQLADATKLFKRAVKNIETSGKTLGSSTSEENVAAMIKAIEAVSKNARVTVKSYQGKINVVGRRNPCE